MRYAFCVFFAILSAVSLLYRDRCCDLDLGSPVDSPSASPKEASTMGKTRDGKSKTKTARARKDNTRSKTSVGRNKTTSGKGSSADLIDVDEVSPKRKPSAGDRKSRVKVRVGEATVLKDFDKADECEIAANSAVERTQRSPVSRRDRSPGKRAVGRPTTRKPSPSLQSPLRAITNCNASDGERSSLQSPLRAVTNYTSDGERSQRESSKVRRFVGEVLMYV